MPTTRRKQTGSTAASQQARLSFNARTARVTKPNAADSLNTQKKQLTKLSEPAEAQIEEITIGTTAAESKSKPQVEAELEKQSPPEAEVKVAIRESPSKTQIQAKKSKKKVVSSKKDEREIAAEKVTDAQLKKYWKAEEDSRLAPRVHQSGVPLHEKILRHFDLSSQYGPCIGIARLARWKRANMLALEPPIEVLAVLLREEDKKTSQGCGKLAYIDELSTGGGKSLLVD